MSSHLCPVTRRGFLKSATTLAGGSLVVPALALGAKSRQRRMPASERIVMGAIGVGARGTSDMRSLMGFDEVQMFAVCDPVPAHCERAKKLVDAQYGNADCAAYLDFRELLAREDIDAVLIGTPDHWHAIIAIEACKRGKDVFCEKPETLTVREGRAMVEAARRYGRVFSGGSQRVLGDYGDWPQLIWGGAIGQVREAYVSCGGPSGVDWAARRGARDGAAASRRGGHKERGRSHGGAHPRTGRPVASRRGQRRHPLTPPRRGGRSRSDPPAERADERCAGQDGQQVGRSN
ncbi:MAG: Gfo/Idh/MocA family oxidoreductase [Verrucomicrobiae bacterium]|nr:Gfo/Idh/MocA family oxidoreductase [Verrucomicrobiae bacterium]